MSDTRVKDEPEGAPANGPGAVQPPAAAPTAPRKQRTVWARIKEHKIAEWTLAYVAFGFAFLHGVTLLSDALEWPHIIVRSVTLLLIVGAPVVPTLAWYHGVRALKRASGSELLIIALLLAIGGSLLWLVPRPAAERARTETTIAKPENQGEASTPPARSIAVLPFVDMSEKKDQEYFGDGMAEEIIDLLVKIPGLKVIGRTSSFEFKGHNEDLRAIGTKLGAAYVVEGSVRKVGDQVRITAQLINTQSGTHEWSETYDRQVGDVLKLQDAIAAAVVRELQLTVVPGDLQSRSSLKNADAYDLILRGRHAADRWDPEDLAEAVSIFQQALRLDPRSADAAAGLAYTYEKIGAYGGPRDSLQQARDAATTALRLDPKNALAHLVLGKVYMLSAWDWAAAQRELKEAASLAPGSSDPLIGQARLSTVLGRCDDALRQIKAALGLDPLDPNSFEALWLIQSCRGHLLEAEAAIRRALDIRPTYILGHVYLGLTLIARGDYDAALLEMQQEPINVAKQYGLVCAYYALRRKTDSDATLASWLKGDHDAYFDAGVYACRNQSDEAFHWLERAYADRSALLPYLKTEVTLRSITADARFKALLQKMNLPE